MCSQASPYLLILALVIGQGTTAVHAQDAAGSKLQRALQAAGRGDCQHALPVLKDVISNNPRLPIAWNAIGVCEAEAGNTSAAVESFRKAVKLTPADWRAWKNLGSGYLAANQPRDAVEAFQRAHVLRPKNAAVSLGLGVALSKAGRKQESFRVLDQAQKLAPEDRQIISAWRDAANLVAAEAADRVEKEQYREAEGLLLQVREALEDNASWNNLLGFVQFKLGHPEPALKHLQKAIQLEPNNESYLLDLSEFLSSHGAYEHARKVIQSGTGRIPASPRLRFALGLTYAAEQRWNEAIEIFEKLVAEQSRMEVAYHALGDCYYNVGRWDAVVSLGKRLQAIDAADALGWYFEGAGLAGKASGDPALREPAVAALHKSLELDPGLARTHFVLGKLYRDEMNYQLAERELKQAIRLEPEHENAHYVLGQLYQRTGQAKLAHQELRIHDELTKRRRENQRQMLLTETPPR